MTVLYLSFHICKMRGAGLVNPFTSAKSFRLWNLRLLTDDLKSEGSSLTDFDLLGHLNTLVPFSSLSAPIQGVVLGKAAPKFLFQIALDSLV